MISSLFESFGKYANNHICTNHKAPPTYGKTCHKHIYSWPNKLRLRVKFLRHKADLEQVSSPRVSTPWLLFQKLRKNTYWHKRTHRNSMLLSCRWNPSDVMPFPDNDKLRSLNGRGNLYSWERRVLNIKQT